MNKDNKSSKYKGFLMYENRNFVFVVQVKLEKPCLQYFKA